MTTPYFWLFNRLNKQPMRRLISDRAYYWLLDHLTENNGWRPLSTREEQGRFGLSRPMTPRRETPHTTHPLAEEATA